MRTFWKKLCRQLQNGRRVFLVLVADCSKGSPGTTGAKMLVSETGTITGTIGGGAMEFQLIERTKEILKQKDFAPEIATLYHRSSGTGETSGMICGGSQTNLYYLCDPQVDKAVLEKAVDILERDISGSLYIEPEGMSVKEKPLVLNQPQVQLTQTAEGWIYEEQLLNCNRIAIVGGGHCSLALSRVMKQLGYEVVVFDARSDVLSFPQTIYGHSIRTVEDYRDAGALIPYSQLTCVVVMTSDFPSDVRALLGVVPVQFPFIGVMGSKFKIARIFQELKQAGISETVLSRIHAPVGLPIGSHTPEEIAISIAAQILQKKHSTHGPTIPGTSLHPFRY